MSKHAFGGSGMYSNESADTRGTTASAFRKPFFRRDWGVSAASSLTGKYIAERKLTSCYRKNLVRSGQSGCAPLASGCWDGRAAGGSARGQARGRPVNPDPRADD